MKKKPITEKRETPRFPIKVNSLNYFIQRVRPNYKIDSEIDKSTLIVDANDNINLVCTTHNNKRFTSKWRYLRSSANKTAGMCEVCLATQKNSRIKIKIFEDKKMRKHLMHPATIIDERYEEFDRIRTDEPIEIKCLLCGNEHKVSIKNFFTETGHQCKVCTQIRREKEGHPLQISLDNINKEIKPYNFKIIKNEKNLSFGKSTLICPKGHKNKMVWLVLKQKIELITEDKHKIETICNKCKELKIFEEKKEYVLKKGFILDCEFNQWKGIRNKYKFICINNQNHIRKTRISSFSKTNQCKECTDEKREKDNFDKFKTLVEKRGGKVKEDINRITKERRVKCRCTYNHDFKISYEKLSINQWCRACVIGISENIVRIIFEHIYKELFPNVRPNFLKSPHSDYNLELDGYNEELELAFEYQGPHHYNNPMVQERDKFKLLQTKEKDITLVIIPEFTPSNNNNDYIDHIVKYLKENNVDIPQFSREIDFSSAFKGSTTHNKFKNILEEHKGEIMPSIENPNAQYKGVGTQLLLSCKNKEHKPFILTPNAIIYYNSWCKLCKKEMK